MSTGYSGTPLAKKLTLKDGQSVWRDGMPPSVAAEIDAAGLALDLVPAPIAGLDHAHLFVTERAALADRLAILRPLVAPDGAVWVSWPKKASKVPTDIVEDTIRAVALPLGFVDVKVCAVDEMWSGLKLVVRRDLRDVKDV